MPFPAIPPPPFIPLPQPPVSPGEFVPPPRMVLDKTTARAEHIFEPARDLVDDIPTPLGFLDNVQINPPGQALRNIPGLFDAIKEGPGPIRDMMEGLDEVIDKVFYRLPGPAGDFHTIRKAAHDATVNMNRVTTEDLPAATATARENTRELTEQVRDMNRYVVDTTPDFLEPLKIGAKGLADAFKNVAENGLLGSLF